MYVKICSDFLLCILFNISRAFTAAECVESQWAIAGNPVTELSVQELISCSRIKGCSGGTTMGALDWLQVHVSLNRTVLLKPLFTDTNLTRVSLVGVLGCP